MDKLDKYVKQVIDLFPDPSDYDPTWKNAAKGQQMRELIDDVTGVPLGPVLEALGPVITSIKELQQKDN